MQILFVYYNHNERYSVIPNSILAAFRSLGHKVITCGRSNRKAGAKPLDIDFQKSAASTNEIIPHLRAKIDLVFVCWPSHHFWITDIERINYPKAVYCVDSHLPLMETWLEGYVRLFDYIFCAQKNFCLSLRRKGIKNVYWIPLAHDPKIHKDYNLKRSYGLGFVGNINVFQNPRRFLFLQILSVLFKIKVLENVYFQKMSIFYSRCKISFNIPVTNDLNARVFETMAAGSMLVTPANQIGILEIFKDKKHLVTYTNIFDLISKVRFYLSAENERQSISKAGQGAVKKHHSYIHRVTKMISTVNKKGASKNRKFASDECLDIAKSQYLLGSLDSTVYWLKRAGPSLKAKFYLFFVTLGGINLERKALTFFSRLSGIITLIWQLIHF